jgi:hypothetical protein
MDNFDNKVNEIIKFISKSDKKTIKIIIYNIIFPKKSGKIIL